ASLLEKGREAVSRARQVLGPDHWVTLWTATGLTIVRAYVGDREAQETARRLGQETMVRARQVLGPDHWVTLYTAAALTLALIRLGEAREACRLGQDTVDRARQGLGHDHPVTLYVAGLLTLALVEVGGRSELETARQLGEDTVDRARRVLDPGNSTDLWAAAGLALARARLGDPKPTVRTHDVLPGGRWALPTKSVETIVEGTDACSRPASALPIAAYMLIAAQGAARGTATTGSTVVEDAGTSLPDDHPAREFVRAVLSWPGDR
ncbi:MAG TPA: tetratricopeptide repeat protein, partial [Kineosporiaceae bacterium]